MLILIMPGVPVRASAVQQDEFPPAGERRGNVGQRGLAHVVVIRRVAAYIDILGRHRHLSIERESPAIWSGGLSTPCFNGRAIARPIGKLRRRPCLSPTRETLAIEESDR